MLRPGGDTTTSQNTSSSSEIAQLAQQKRKYSPDDSCFEIIQAQLKDRIKNFKDSNPFDYQEYEKDTEQNIELANKFFSKTTQGTGINTLGSFFAKVISPAALTFRKGEDNDPTKIKKVDFGAQVINSMAGMTQRSLKNPDIGLTMATILFDKYYDVWYPSTPGFSFFSFFQFLFDFFLKFSLCYFI